VSDVTTPDVPAVVEETRSPRTVDESVAQKLVERARTKGVELVGPGGLLTGLTKTVLETTPEAELDEHLGCEARCLASNTGNSSNSRNGSRAKTVLTEVGEGELEVPRDRDGSFEPNIVRKRRRISGGDELVISLAAKGPTTGEIAAHFADVYGAEVSKDTISRITEAVMEEPTAWQSQSLEQVYPVVFIDAIQVKIRDGKVVNRPVHAVVGVTVAGERDILGLWVGDGSEGAKYRHQVLPEILNRGTVDVCIVCCDGLRGLPDAIADGLRSRCDQSQSVDRCGHTRWELCHLADRKSVGCRLLRPPVLDQPAHVHERSAFSRRRTWPIPSLNSSTKAARRSRTSLPAPPLQEQLPSFLPSNDDH